MWLTAISFFSWFLFFRLNAFFAKEISKYQPISENPKVTKNSMRYRGLEGFVAAVSPFNFTAIGGNLAYTPTLMVLNTYCLLCCNDLKWTIAKVDMYPSGILAGWCQFRYTKLVIIKMTLSQVEDSFLAKISLKLAVVSSFRQCR